ncbi:hypothetical protein RchiOBHm_Chr7g0199621 [Rosa chinensis]|uniref:Uncharacterized protein n=1 Tax=Rosa chinensis TaxID=74649 RepID=A0A2P6P7G6_ROSCH|nr:hypothetical protein RchiOBHm_Chr7g0199621 [Rosa chinensis]
MVSQKTIFPFTLSEFRAPFGQKLAISELAPAEKLAASPPHIRGYDFPFRLQTHTIDFSIAKNCFCHKFSVNGAGSNGHYPWCIIRN